LTFYRQGNKFESLGLDDAIAEERNGTEDASDDEVLGKVLTEWLTDPETREDTWIHRSAIIRGNEQINATENSRERSRMSFFIKVRWNIAPPSPPGNNRSRPTKRQRTNRDGTEDNSTRRLQEIEEQKLPYVAAVQYFVRIPLKGQESAYARFSICDYYHYQEPLQDADTGDIIHV
jgi:hypothetical protein